ncbi:hypothetical protein CUMW_267240 [Citrus unshiu]|uniref:Uncharacterized protein n=1 Tax=Citrus unshiu TaxID=55188 RepID=A0A2H5QW29_CITUN|nr:hypothetical protein CUMW_267240 [Citrus unshiu]
MSKMTSLLLLLSFFNRNYELQCL